MKYAAANVLYKHREVVLPGMGFMKKYLSGDDVSKDLKLMLEWFKTKKMVNLTFFEFTLNFIDEDIIVKNCRIIYLIQKFIRYELAINSALLIKIKNHWVSCWFWQLSSIKPQW